MEKDEEFLVVIIGSDDEADEDQNVKVKKKIKEEPLDGYDLIDIIETAKKHGEHLDVVNTDDIKQELEEYDPQEDYEYFLPTSENYEEDKTIEYLDEDKYEVIQSDLNENDWETNYDNDDDDEYIPPGNQSQSEEEDSDPDPDRRKRWTMVPPDQQKSFISDLKQEYPELTNNENALISTLTEIMHNVEKPAPPPDYFIMNEISFECRKCGFMTERIQTIERHYREKHGPRYLVCFACGVDFRSTTNLYKHEKRCLAPDAVVMLRARAIFLGRKGRGRPFLPKPTDVVERRPAKRFHCSRCSASFNCRTNLEAHENMHLGLRPYRCKECTSAYTSSARLMRHMKTHSDEKFICDHCGQIFKMKPILVAHLNTHLPVPRFGCDECDRRFATNNGLKHHVRRVHLQLPPAHNCPICPKSFPRMSLVKQHVARDHGLSLMTRNMFFKRLPKLTDEQLVKAVDILKVDVVEDLEPLFLDPF